MKRIALLATLLLALATTVGAQSPYFAVSQLPNGVAFLPPPPDSTSIQYASDMNLYLTGMALRGTERGAEAVDHANGVYTHICDIFSPAFGLAISPTATPAIYTVLANSLKTTSIACSGAKIHYDRRRPFQTFNDTLGTSETLNGTSYPSSHSAKGWMVALLLIEINPEAQDSLLKLGYEYGQSRVIVGAHWQSDVDAARLIGSSTYARLHTSARFLQEMAAAQEEYALLTDTIPPAGSDPVSLAHLEAGLDSNQWHSIAGQPASTAVHAIVPRKGRKAAH